MNAFAKAVRRSIEHDSDMAPIIANVPYFKLPKDAGEEDSPTNEANEAKLKTPEYENTFRECLDPSNGGGYFLTDDNQSMSDDEVRRKIDLLLHEPTVYIVYFHEPKGGYKGYNKGDNRRDWTVYVGETNHIAQRTVQHVLHVEDDEDHVDDAGNESEAHKWAREKQTIADKTISYALKNNVEVRQFVIHQGLFNKSLTLDIENKLIDYMQSVANVHCLNGRSNAQGRYFTAEAMPYVVSAIWNRLCGDNDRILDVQSKHDAAQSSHKKAKKQKTLSTLFELEENIWNLSTYKLSPFHSLGDGQKKAIDEVRAIADRVVSEWPANPRHRLFLLEGSAGTGKSIVLSSLFYRLCTEYDMKTPPLVKLLVHNEELLKQYREVAKLQNILKSRRAGALAESDNVLKAGTFAEKNTHDVADIVLVDEAHLLFTAKGFMTHKNYLSRIVRRAKVVIAVFDPHQIMNSRMQWDRQLLEKLFEGKYPEKNPGEHEERLLRSEPYEMNLPSTETTAQQPIPVTVQRLRLNQQFRICGSDAMVHWIQALTGADEDEMFITAKSASSGISASRIIKPIPDEESQGTDDGAYIPFDEKQYSVKVYSSPLAMLKALDNRRKSFREELEDMRKKSKLSSAYPITDLCRITATYDWPFSSSKHRGSVTLYRIQKLDGHAEWRMPKWEKDGLTPVPDLKEGERLLDSFDMPWNDGQSMLKSAESVDLDGTSFGDNADKNDHWVSRRNTEQEVGSYFTVQGADLNVAAVIIGPSVTCGHISDNDEGKWIKRGVDGHEEEVQYIQFEPEYSKDPAIKVIKEGDDSNANDSSANDSSVTKDVIVQDAIDFNRTFIRNQLNVLLTRGVRELYIYAVDEGLRAALKDAVGGYAKD